MTMTSSNSARSVRCRGGASRSRVLVAVAGAWLAVTSPSFATDGDVHALEVASRMFEGMPADVVMDGSLALVGLDTGLATYTLTDEHALALLGHVRLPGPVLSVAGGALALAACDGAGCFVIDVGDPRAPAVVGRMHPRGLAKAVGLGQEVAFVVTSGATSAAGSALEAYSLVNPRSPALLGSLSLPGSPRCIALGVGLALVGMGDRITGAGSGLAVVDVSDPASLVMVSVLSSALPVNAIAVRGDAAFLASGVVFTGAVEAVDLSDPGIPRRVGRLALSDTVEDVAIGEQGHLLLAASSLGILRVDASDPGRMFLADARPTGRITVAIARSATEAIVAERSSIGPGGVAVVDVPDSGRLDLVSVEPLAEAMDVAVSNGLAFMLLRDALHVVDARDPRAPRLLSSWRPVDADFSALAVSGCLAAVGDGSDVLLVDVSDPLHLRPRGRATLRGGVATDLVFAADVLLVADGRELELIDVADPDLPVVRGTYAPATWASSVAAQDALAVVAGGSGLETIDLSAPMSPRRLGRIDAGDVLLGVSIRGDLVMVAGQESAVILVDVSDPSAPRVVSRVPGGPGFDVSAEGDRVAVAASSRGVLVFDVSVPASPRVVGSLDTSGVAQAVVLDGDVVHLAAEGAGHWILVPGALPMIVGEPPRERLRGRPGGFMPARPRITEPLAPGDLVRHRQ